MTTFPDHRYPGARALVELHELHLRSFLETWRRARAADVTLPETDDPDYASLPTLLRHVLGAAAGYMRWICQQLDLPDPGLNPSPPSESIEQSADEYLEHVLDRWRSPLVDVPPESFDRPTYPSTWKIDYCIDAMLEHAVMHPIRHQFQLKNLIARQG